MRLIHDQKEIIGEIVKNRIWWLARKSLIKIERIIFDPVYKSGFSDHSDIIFNSLFDSLSFDRHSELFKFFDTKLFFCVHLNENLFEI